MQSPFTLSSEELQSKTIDFLRFPLIVGVILIHTSPDSLVVNGTYQDAVSVYPVYSTIYTLCSQILPRLAVPIFFIISGFLFFYHTPVFDKSAYWSKLKKRARTLLVPYLLWNALVILFYFFAEVYLSGLYGGKGKLVSQYWINDYIYAFYDTTLINTGGGGESNPINYPLWFLRDLIIVVCLSPLVYVLIKRLKFGLLIVLGGLWISDCTADTLGRSLTSFFFFSLGAYFSIFSLNLVEKMRKVGHYTALPYLCCALASLYCFGLPGARPLYNLSIVLGIPVVFAVTAHYISLGRWKMPALLTKATFFLYAFHALPLAALQRLLNKVLQPQNDLLLLAIYLLLPLLIIAVGLSLYQALQKVCPRLAAVLTGSR